MSFDYRHETLDGFPRELLNNWEREDSRFGKTWKTCPRNTCQRIKNA